MPSFNPERAEVPLEFPDGRTLKLVMDYQAVSALIAKLGDQWDTVISTASGNYDCKTLCDVVEILAARNHPDLTAADIMTASPAWMKLVNALNAAHNVFLFGYSGPPVPEMKAEAEDGEEDGEERPFANGQDGAKSSNPRWQRLLRRVYGQQSSGR